MELIVVAVLIQTLYYLAYDQHLFIVLFIGLSLLGQQYTDHKKYYLGIPIVLTHTIYLLYSRLYKRDLEQFKYGKKKYKNSRKGAKKGVNKTTKGAKRTARKAHKGMKKAQKAIKKAVEENARVVGTIQSGITNAYKQAVKAAQDDNDGVKLKETPDLDTTKAEKADYDPKRDAPKI